MKRDSSEKYEDYKSRLFSMARAVKRYLKGRFISVGKRYVPPVPKRIGKFTKKHYNFEKAKRKKMMQKLSRRRNRRR